MAISSSGTRGSVTALTAAVREKLANKKDTHVFQEMHEKPERTYETREQYTLLRRIALLFDTLATKYPDADAETLREHVLGYTPGVDAKGDVSYPLRDFQRSMPRVFAMLTVRARTSRQRTDLNSMRYFLYNYMQEKVIAEDTGLGADYVSSTAQMLAWSLNMKPAKNPQPMTPEAAKVLETIKPIKVDEVANLVNQPLDEDLDALDRLAVPYENAPGDDKPFGDVDKDAAAAAVESAKAAKRQKELAAAAAADPFAAQKAKAKAARVRSKTKEAPGSGLP